MINYKDFRATIDDFEKHALDIVFTFSGSILDDRFENCYFLAEELIKLEENDVDDAVKILSVVPSSYVSASLVISKKLDKIKNCIFTKIKQELLMVYLKDFNLEISGKKCKFALFNKSSIDCYLSSKTRMVDENEIIKLAKSLNIKFSDIIGEYKGEDNKTLVLNKAMHRIRLNSVQNEYKDVIDKVIISSLEEATKNFKKLNKIKEVKNTRY